MTRFVILYKNGSIDNALQKWISHEEILMSKNLLNECLYCEYLDDCCIKKVSCFFKMRSDIMDYIDERFYDKNK